MKRILPTVALLLGVVLSGGSGLAEGGGGVGSSSANSVGGSGSSSFIYSAGRGKTNKKDLSNAFVGPVSPAVGASGAASTSSLVSTAFVEPRGDYGGGAGFGGGGYGGGGYGGGGEAGGVYHYAIQPHGGGGGGGGGGWQPPPVYYQDDGYEGGLDKGLLGLLGLGGLGGLKGLLGLAALAKLLLPLLLLLLPLLLPLLLAKAGLLLALLLLIPIPVITTGRNLLLGKESPESAKAILQDTMAELMTKIPFDISHIVSRIKESDFFKNISKKRESQKNGRNKNGSSKDNKPTLPSGTANGVTFQSFPGADVKDNLVHSSSS